MDTLFPHYTVSYARSRPDGRGAWEGTAWKGVIPLDVTHFHPSGSSHCPRAQVKMLHDEACLYGLFRVEDRYVICRNNGYQRHVYEDSCVEFFAKPKPDAGYMNFEMSCGGHLLLYYISDHRRKRNPTEPDDEFERFVKVPHEIGSRVTLFHSLPSVVEPEISEPTPWTLEFHIPLAVLEQYVGNLRPLAGQTWRANFNKCADACTHPHWAAWASIGEELNLHQPDRFGVLHFAEP